jgi:hypothetical protein
MQGRYRQTKPTKCGGTDDGESEHLIVPLKQGNQPKGTLWREGDAEFTELKEGQMAEAPTSRTVSTRLRQIASLARDAPTMAFSNLAHHIDLDLLREAHRRTRKDGAVGIDRQTAALYAENLEGNLQDLEGVPGGVEFAGPRASQVVLADILRGPSDMLTTVATL